MATKFIEDWRDVKSKLGNIINEVDTYNQNYTDVEAFKKKFADDIYGRGYKEGHEDGLKDAIHPLYLEQETKKAFDAGYEKGYLEGALKAYNKINKQLEALVLEIRGEK